MEGEDENEFCFFKDYNFDDEDLYKVFPFSESYANEAKYYDVIFPKLGLCSGFENQKNIMDEYQLLEKISKFEQNYNNFVHQDFLGSPTNNQIDRISQNFESNLKLAEGTLPGLIISIMYKEASPIDENSILNQVYSKFDDLRKSNGSKYSGDVKKVLQSTLRSSGLFLKTVDEKFYFREKEALDFIIKTTEKELKKKMNREKRENKSLCTQSSMKSKKKGSELSFTGQMNYKMSKVSQLLDQMLTKCRGKIEQSKLNNSFNNGSIELLQKIGEQNKMIGILMCLKFFKSIINKYFKLIHKKKKLETLIDLNKLNDKIELICKKIEEMEKTFFQVSSDVSHNEQITDNINQVNITSYSGSNNLLSESQTNQ